MIHIKNIWFLAGLVVTGIGLISAGSLVNDVISTSIGGALLGASISAALAEKESIKMLDIIKKSLESDFKTPEKILNRYRKKWHAYHVTEVEGKKIWYHYVLDFSASPLTNTLYCKSTRKDVISNDGDAYIVTAGFRDQRGIMFGKAVNSDEPTTVTVFPSMGEAYYKYHCGIRILRTYSGSDYVSPVIIGESPVEGVKKIGVIECEELTTILDKLWTKQFHKLNTVLPKVTQ